MIAVFLIIQALIAVPAPVRADLDAACAGWRLAPVIPEVAAEVATRTPSWPPNLIPGDFNGDGQADVALLVDCNGRVELLAFLATASGFAKHNLEKPQPLDPRQFLHLIRKEYEHDAVGVEFDAIGGHAWIYRANRWQSVAR